MLNLQKGARPDERFHLQAAEPAPRVWSFLGIRRITWENLTLQDGSPGTFRSWWIFGNAIHWYRGTVKCDATRTSMYRAGQLDDGQGEPYAPDQRFVMTTTPKEMASVRFFVQPGDAVWTNMGGS